tara:strand:+ start:179 stop:631 length:453 start_codon:yes stop_codon:yes gene_type:complete
MTLPEDFHDFLQLLKKNEVQFLVVGGWAVGLHGYPRATGDIDVWIATTEENVGKLTASLQAFGVSHGVPNSFFFERGNVFRIGRIPVKIEVLTSISGVEFADCYSRRTSVTIDSLEIPFISLEDLRTNKKASGRPKDLADLDALQYSDGE